MEEPRFSVVITAPDWPPTLSDCLAALSRQQLDDREIHWGEILLVGPALPAELTTRFTGSPLTVQHLEWQSTAGDAGAARNLGALHARGQLLLFLEPDTWCGSGFLATHAAAHRNHPEWEVGVVSGETEGASYPLAAATREPVDRFYHDPRCPLGLRFQQEAPEEGPTDGSLGDLVGLPFSVKRTWFERHGGFAVDLDVRLLPALELECRYRSLGFRVVRAEGGGDAGVCRSRPSTATALLPWCEAWGAEAFRIAEREPASAAITRLGLLLALPVDGELLTSRQERLLALEEWLRRSSSGREMVQLESIRQSYLKGLAEVALLAAARGARTAAQAAGWTSPLERLRNWVPAPSDCEWIAGQEPRGLKRVGASAELPVVRLAGRRAVRLRPGPKGDRRLEFGREAEGAQNEGADQRGWSSVDPLMVTVEYLDAGSSTWRLEFLGRGFPPVARNAETSGKPDGDQEAGWRATAKTIQNTNTGSWRRATFTLSGWAAAETGRGAWFQVVGVHLSGPELALGRVRISAGEREGSWSCAQTVPVSFPQAEAPELSVVVDAQGGARTLAACLHSLFDSLPRTFDGNYEVLILDDRRSRERTRYLQECEGIRVVSAAEASLNEPISPSHGLWKQGIAVARGNFLAFLSDQVLPLPGWLSPLQSELETYKAAGAAGGLAVSPQGLIRYPAFFEDPGKESSSWEEEGSAIRQPWEKTFTSSAEVPLASFSAVLLRRAAFEAIERFSKEPHLHPLGIDLSLSLAEAGWSTRFCPASTVQYFNRRTGTTVDPGRWEELRTRWEELRRRKESVGLEPFPVDPASSERFRVNPVERTPPAETLTEPSLPGIQPGHPSARELPAFPEVENSSSASTPIPPNEMPHESVAATGEPVVASNQTPAEANEEGPGRAASGTVETEAIHPLLAPLGMRGEPKPWAGRLVRKPWEYSITAVIPHLETPEPLRLCVELLRLQSERPYILVIDTGSTDCVRAELEGLRAEDLEIHYILSHGYQHCAEAVGVAQDLAFALCRSEYLFCTHADCFLRRRDYLEWLLTECGPERPVVGYQMSPRDWLTDDWEGMVSHTATLLHMATMHRLGVTWSFERSHVQFGVTRTDWGWPDTETCMNLVLRAAGIQPHLIGLEENFKRHVDENLDHVRSYPGSALYAPHYHAHAKRWMAEALAEAAERIEQWRSSPLPAGERIGVPPGT